MSGERYDIKLSPRDRRIKAAFRDLVSACGGQEEAGGIAERGQQRISLYGHPNSDVFAPLDVVARLEAAARGAPGHPHVTRVLARDAGCELVLLPDAAQPGVAWSQHIAALAKEGGELMSAVCAALADDNDVSSAEARRALRDADELVAVAVSLRAALKIRAEEDGR